jgi:hypothetical protein
MLRCHAGKMRHDWYAFGPLFLMNCTGGGDGQGLRSPQMGEIMASTRRRKLKKLRMKKANHGKRPLAGK